MHGRAGILAHSYLLGPNGQSNGCVSIRDYQEFLDAYLRGEIDRIVVVERLAQVPAPKTAGDWFKDLFRDREAAPTTACVPAPSASTN